MPEIPNTPKDWLLDLNKAILSSGCKKKGKIIGFEDGLTIAESLIQAKIKSGSSVWWVGNGGSAAMCSHLSQDMLNKLGARSMVLGDASLMTCMANDFGYENVYYKPLKTLAKSGDLLIAISSSGDSENIISCSKMALETGIDLISLSGLHENNRLWSMESDLSFFVTSNLYGIVEVAHEAILHSVIETLWLNKKEILNG